MKKNDELIDVPGAEKKKAGGKDYPAQIATYREELAKNPSDEIKLKLANALRNHGWNIYFERKYEEARKYFLEASEYYLQLNKAYERFKAKTGLGLCESGLGNFIGAQLIFTGLAENEKIKAEVSKEADEDELKIKYAKLNLYLSIVHYKRNNWKKALECSRKAYYMFSNPGDKGACLQGLGKVFVKVKEYDKAKKAFKEARSLFEETKSVSRIANIDENTAECLIACGEYEKAKELIDSVIEAYREIGNERQSAYFARAKAYEGLGDVKKANDDYLKAVELIETKRGEIQLDIFRQSFFVQQIEIYSDAVLSFFSAEDVNTAYELAQKAKSRSFNEKLETGFNESVLNRPEFAKFKKTCENIDSVRSQIEREEQDRNLILILFMYESLYAKELQNLKERNPQGIDLVVNDALPVKEIQNAIDPQTAVIDYYATKEILIIFCITKGSRNAVVVPIKFGDLLKISANAKLWLFNAEQATNSESKERIHKWYKQYVRDISDILFTPVEKYLNGASRLIFVPHLSLHYLPFGLLLTKEGKRLVENYEIATLPTVRLLNRQKDKKNIKDLKALIISNPIGDLKHANEEAEAIEKIITGPTLLTGVEAKKERILKDFGKYSLIHFACHAKVNHASPMLSELVVSTGTEGEKTRITLSEIFFTKNNADLVVLSGCETGIGDITPGDEITCFPRAFIYAGAKTVLVSLWEIDDSSTSILMQEFYKEWVQNKQSKAKALQLAQLSMIAKGYSPYHWAGFQLIGK